MSQKYSEPFCEFGRSSIQGLIVELNQNPAAKGRIVLHPSLSDPLWPYKEKAAIKNLFDFSRFDAKRVEIVLGEPEIKTSTELWIEPLTASADLNAKPWDLSIPTSQPLLVHSNSWVDGIGCGLFRFDHKFFADVLRKNTDFGGRIIIRDISNSAFEKRKRKISKDLFGPLNKLSRKHLEFAFLKDKNADVEYWLVPADHFGPFSGN